MTENLVPPLIELRIQKVVGDTRHALRQDITSLGTQITTAQLTGSREHAVNLVALNELKALIAPLADVPKRLAALERSEDVSDALRRTLWKVSLFLVSVVAAFSGVIIAVLS